MCSEMRCSRFGRMNVGLGLSFFKYYSIRWPRTLRKVAILTPEFLFFFFLVCYVWTTGKQFSKFRREAKKKEKKSMFLCDHLIYVIISCSKISIKPETTVDESYKMQELSFSSPVLVITSYYNSSVYTALRENLFFIKQAFWNLSPT